MKTSVTKAAALGTLGLLAACGGKQDAGWVEKQQKATEAAKAKVKEEQQAQLQPVKPAEPEVKDSYWDDPSLVRWDNEAKCPEGLWALFPGKAPGTEKQEQRANEAKRGELAKKLRATRFSTWLRPPNDVKLLDYDAPKGQFPLPVVGLIDCQDSYGHLSVLFTDGKAITPNKSAAKADAEIVMRIWDAKPFDFVVPIASVTEAKEFKSRHQFDLEARVVFTLGKVEVDKRIFRTSKVSAAGMNMGGGAEDWGAGRAVHASVEGVRVSTDHGRKVIQDTRKH
jgi:hypothetical protein